MSTTRTNAKATPINGNDYQSPYNSSTATFNDCYSELTPYTVLANS